MCFECDLTVDQIVEVLEVLAARLVVIDELAMHETQGDVRDAAVAERFVGLLDGKLQKIGGITDVAACRSFGVKQHEIDGDFLGLELLAFDLLQRLDIGRRRQRNGDRRGGSGAIRPVGTRRVIGRQLGGIGLEHGVDTPTHVHDHVNVALVAEHPGKTAILPPH